MGDVIIDGLTGANRLVILDANGKIPALDGSNVTLLAGANFSTGTIPVARIDTGTTAGKIVKLDGNAKLPAVSGVALTGVVGATKSTSDPALNTNPSSGVGAEWHNKTSGEVYVCTDATAGANVWVNVGGHSGNIQALQFGGQGGGTAYGYRCGGYYPGVVAEQDKYSYATDGNAVQVANIAISNYAAYGCQSSTVGYVMAGTPAGGRTVQKYTFASNASASLGTSHLLVSHSTGCVATNSSTYAYCMGGATTPAVAIDNEKMAFSSEAAFANVGDCYDANLGHSLGHGSGHASYTHGYRAGGHTDGPSSQQTDKIEKFTFAADANSTLVASMGRGIDTGISGASSITHGYMMGGHGAGQTEIDKFPFATDSASVDVGDLHTGEAYSSGTSSLTHGYMAGGGHPQINNIQKISFSADGNATDVGDIINAKAYCMGYHD